MLTAGILTQVPAMRDTQYIQSISQSPYIERLGDINDPNTLLTINMPDIKAQITTGFETQARTTLPAPAAEKAITTFTENQQIYSSNVTHAFSQSLQRIFIVAASLIGLAAVLVFTLREKKLRSASPEATPGNA